MNEVIRRIIVAIIVLAGLIYFNPFREHTIRFELIETYNHNNESIYWIAVTENGFITLPMYNDERSKKGIYVNEKMNTQEASYVVCYGCRLKKAVYNLLRVCSLSHKPYYNIKCYIIPEKDTSTVNVYSMNKKNIDIDIHTQYGDTIIMQQDE